MDAGERRVLMAGRQDRLGFRQRAWWGVKGMERMGKTAREEGWEDDGEWEAKAFSLHMYRTYDRVELSSVGCVVLNKAIDHAWRLNRPVLVKIEDTRRSGQTRCRGIIGIARSSGISLGYTMRICRRQFVKSEIVKGEFRGGWRRVVHSGAQGWISLKVSRERQGWVRGTYTKADGTR